MDNPQEKRNLAEAEVIINYDEPPRRSPPGLSVGPVGWIRENLFGSPFDSVLTLISAFLIVTASVTLLTWSVGTANWLVVNQNFRNFMAGTYPLESIWRLELLVNLTAFVTGLTIATYSRAGRRALVLIGLTLLALFSVPVIARATLPNPSTFLAAGAVDIQSGTVTETPTDTIAFTALAGANVRITVAEAFTTDSDTVAIGGFGDRPIRAYFNAAQNRLSSLARVDEIERTLDANARVDAPFLSCSQFLDLKRELVALQRTLNPLALSEEAAAFEVDDATLLSCEDLIAFPETDFSEISAIYDTNQSSVDVRVLTGDSLDLLGEATLSSGEGELMVTIPETGWYVLQSEVADEGVLVVLDAINIYPLIERAVVQVRTDEDGEPLVNVNTGNVEQDSIQEYVNIYTQDVTRVEPPVMMVEDEAENVTLLRLTDAKYLGERPIADYMTLSLGPLFDRMDMAMLWFAIFGVIGYGSGIGIKRTTPRVPGAGMAGVATLGGWMLFTFLLFVLTIGVASLSGIGLANLSGMVVWVGIMFFLGMMYNSFGKSIGQPLLGLGLVMILGHIVVYRLTIDPRPAFSTADEAGWILSIGFILQLVLWMVIGLGAFQSGVGNESALGNGARRMGFFGAVGLWIALIVGVPLIINGFTATPLLSNYGSENLLPIADMNLWGGFLLTFMLTAVGIVASFPIGVLLALGRRADRYPAIKYICILYIEFVRGVPLVSVLFMASLLVPLVDPNLATVPGVVRAMIGITMFSAAYLAENVRGGLQSIPGGQEEAGKALGLNNVQVTSQIMLPQALRAVIPALVGQAISLFKDTSLVYIVGLADLTRVAIRVVAQSEFVGHRLETLTFISVIYFIFSYVMSYVSRRIEESGSGSARR